MFQITHFSVYRIFSVKQDVVLDKACVEFEPIFIPGLYYGNSRATGTPGFMLPLLIRLGYTKSFCKALPNIQKGKESYDTMQ